MVAAVSKAIRSVRTEVLRQRFREALSVDLRDRLRGCEVPFLYVEGTRDRMLGKRGLRQIASVMPGVKRVVVDGPHLLLQCRPHQVVQAIEPTLHDWFAI